MKRVTSLFLALVMLFSLTATAFAQSIIPTADKTSIKTGEQVKVTMTMEETISKVVTATFHLVYNEELFEFDFDSSEPGECDIAKSGDVGGQVWNGYVKYTYSNTRTAGGTLNAGTVLAALVFTAKADVTAEQIATFTSKVETFALTDGTHPVDQFTKKSVSVTVTPATTAVEGYAVAASAANSSIIVGEKANVALKISNTAVTTYNAYYMEVSYDAEKLTYTKNDAGATVTDDGSGKLKIAGYGTDRACGETGEIVLTFTSKDVGDAKVTVNSAKVDAKANAAEKDAPTATLNTAEATINVGGYQVILPDDFTGAGTANPGEDYTFNAKDTNKKYDFSGSTMGGETVEIIDNGGGSYTVKKVTGPLEIKATALASKVAINLSGDAVDTISQKSWGDATEVDEGMALWFMAAPNGKELVVTVNGEEITGVNRQGMYSYTIAADKVTGDALNIVVNYKSSTDTITIIETGDAWGDVTGRITWDEGGGQIDMSTAGGATYTLKLKPAKDKTKDDYVVTINGETMELKNMRRGEWGVDFVPNKVADRGKITIDVSYKKAPEPTITVDVSEYLKLDNQSIFLITATCDELTESKVLAYNEKPMYWSSKYNKGNGAYAWLVIADGTKKLDDLKTEASAQVKAVDGIKVEIAYDGDVNQTKSVDINDAQLVWNMYNAEYKTDTDFQMVNRLKYLSADMNGDRTVSVLDATAIVDNITK